MFKLTYENLDYAIGAVAALKPSRIDTPLLQNIRVECIDGTVWFTSASGISRLSVPVDAGTGSEDGLVSIPGAATNLIPAIMKTLPEEGYVEISNDGTKTELNFGGGNVTRLVSIAPEALYERLKVDGNIIATFPGELLASAIQSVLPAVGTGSSSPVLDGVHVGVGKDNIAYLECTDSYRLARSYMAEYSGDGINIIIPAESAQEIKRLVAHGGDVTFIVKNNELVIKTAAGVMYSTQLIGGYFPNVETFIADGNLDTKIICQKEMVLATASATKAIDAGVMVFTTENNQTTISATGIGGDMSVTLDCTVMEAPAETRSFKAGCKYITDAARTFGGGFTIGTSGKHTPIIMKDSTQIHVIMPIIA